MGKITKAIKEVTEGARALEKVTHEVSGAAKKAEQALQRVAKTTEKTHVKPLDVGTYGELKKLEQVGDNLEHDHIPSSAALKKAKEKQLGRKLTPKEAREIHERGIAIEVPKEVHAKGNTFRGKNTPDQIDADASDLSVAAERDYTATRTNLIDHGYSPEAVDAALAKMYKLNRGAGI